MKQKKITREEIPSMEEKDRMKYEIAEELGLLDQVLEEGWKSLSSKETGRIGGLSFVLLFSERRSEPPLDRPTGKILIG